MPLIKPPTFIILFTIFPICLVTYISLKIYFSMTSSFTSSPLSHQIHSSSVSPTSSSPPHPSPPPPPLLRASSQLNGSSSASMPLPSPISKSTGLVPSLQASPLPSSLPAAKLGSDTVQNSNSPTSPAGLFTVSSINSSAIHVARSPTKSESALGPWVLNDGILSPTLAHTLTVSNYLAAQSDDDRIIHFRFVTDSSIEFVIHRSRLLFVSGPLAALVRRPFTNQDQDVIYLSDRDDPENFRHIRRFLYTQSINLVSSSHFLLHFHLLL